MISTNLYQKLYPNLKFTQVIPPTRSVSQDPKPVLKTPVVETRPQIIEKIDTIIEKPPTIDPPKEKDKVEQPAITDEPVKAQTPKKSVKVKIPRPNRLKPEPKPKPVRDSQLPIKGEQGLQRRYTEEQRKNIYLERLSRRSVKAAEKEIAKVQSVLESNEGSRQRLNDEEKRLKGQLRLINTAKFFAATSNINDKQNLSEPKRPPLSDETVTAKKRHPTSSRSPGRDRGRNGDIEISRNGSRKNRKRREPSPSVESSCEQCSGSDSGVTDSSEEDN
jgi:hypothetical protein